MEYVSMTATSPHQAATARTHEEANLDRRYGEIGISAVAAAVRYQSEPKNPAYAPTDQRHEKLSWIAEVA
jgi:hypothetical protein